MAEELVKLGHCVTVFEAWPRPGGLLVYGIPGFKLNKQIVWEKIRYLEELGVEFRCNTRIGRELTVDDLLGKHGFNAVFLGHGASTGHRMKIPGEELRYVYNATEQEGQTSREEEIWAAGDCVRGADLIVTAMAPARKTARSIDRALRARLRRLGPWLK